MADANDISDAVNEASNATTIAEATNNTSTRQNQNERALKRKREMARINMLGTWVLGKHSKLVPNPKGPEFRRAGDWALGNVIKSIGNNNHEVKFNNRIIREYLS